MYETKQEATGLRGGFGRPKPTQRIDCVPASVLYEGQRSRASLQEKGARARRQTRTGCVKTSYGNDSEILAGKPKVLRWLIYLLAGLTMSGVLPMVLAEGLIWFTDAYSCEWLALVLLAAVIFGICRAVGREL